MKAEEQRRARELRALGWSIGEIERELGVSRSSVSLWVRRVALSDEARARLEWRTGLGPQVTAVRKAAAARALRQAAQECGRVLARERDASYAIGCMLYWAEGAKSRNYISLVNSDPELVVTFVGFMRKHFRVADDGFAVRCNLFADHIEKQREFEQFWLDRLELPQSCLRKSHVNVYSKYSQKKRKNKLPYGTCEIRVFSTEIVQTIYGSIQEYGGFDRPEWLD